MKSAIDRCSMASRKERALHLAIAAGRHLDPDDFNRFAAV